MTFTLNSQSSTPSPAGTCIHHSAPAHYPVSPSPLASGLRFHRSARPSSVHGPRLSVRAAASLCASAAHLVTGRCSSVGRWSSAVGRRSSVVGRPLVVVRWSSAVQLREQSCRSLSHREVKSQIAASDPPPRLAASAADGHFNQSVDISSDGRQSDLRGSRVCRAAV